MKYTVEISRVEYYKGSVVVEAESEEQAKQKVYHEWVENDYIYEKITDYPFDVDMQFNVVGPATEQDEKNSINI